MCSTEADESAKQERESAKVGVVISDNAAWEKRITNGVLIGVPALGTVYAILFFAKRGINPAEVSVFLAFYFLTGIGIGLGYHRFLTHQAFVPVKWLKVTLIFLGSLAFQGSALRWVADHRRHHRLSDQPFDTHSPKYCETKPSRSTIAGLWHAHFAWMFDRTTTNYEIYVPDLLEDRECVLFSRHYVLCTILSLVLPFLVGCLLGGFDTGWRCLLLGGFVRVSLLHQFIWAVNSLGHTFGKQDASKTDSSRNNFLLALATLGEGWHNNHHAMPRSAWNQWKWYQLDFNGWLILALRRLGLVTDVVFPRISQEHGNNGF